VDRSADEPAHAIGYELQRCQRREEVRENMGRILREREEKRRSE
jgi:hypothetical protein